MSRTHIKPTIHNLGFPRLGAKRELKFTLERYWRGEIDQAELLSEARITRSENWQRQKNAGMDLIPVGDFALYDHVLQTSALLGNLPARARNADNPIDQLFLASRGASSCSHQCHASEMTKWFDTNYHYLVPEFDANTDFTLNEDWLIEEVQQALAEGINAKPVILGPISYLWLGKSLDESERLALLPKLIPVYQALLNRLGDLPVDWIQIDEPALAMDLPQNWKQTFEPTYHSLKCAGAKRMIATYFSGLDQNLTLAFNLPVEGIHVDLVRAPEQLTACVDLIGPYKVLSAGVIDGRNIWLANLTSLLQTLKPISEKLGERLWLAPSCSLLHVPYDTANETRLDEEALSWLAFAQQKLDELVLLKGALSNPDQATALLEANLNANQARVRSARIHRDDVKARHSAIQASDFDRQAPFADRQCIQQEKLKLPLFPTTTIGSFPQTQSIRQLRKAFKQSEISANDYTSGLKDEIQLVIEKQESLGIDVLVHGEAERNDMVEYFGEQLEGFWASENGWVQSYGSRCVKPPIIFGDVKRSQPMTVEWAKYAQSLTSKHVKGMLTGPITILQWSFVRDDQPRQTTAEQIALAIRDEVLDLEAAGITIIQVDEPALREGLPLEEANKTAYLNWAVNAFRLSCAAVKDETQIHTHMCYAEFDDIIQAIIDMDADVITLETARSAAALVSTLAKTPYPNAMGPGVYDIHSPNVPDVSSMSDIIKQANQHIDRTRLWVNPDCGLKTRGWPEVEEALSRMVSSAKQLRAELA